MDPSPIPLIPNSTPQHPPRKFSLHPTGRGPRAVLGTIPADALPPHHRPCSTFWKRVPFSQAPWVIPYWGGVLPSPQVVPCCLPIAAAQNPGFSPFLSLGVHCHPPEQRGAGGRGGSAHLGAFSPNLCMTNPPPGGLRGAPPAPASPRIPPRAPLAAAAGGGMAARAG